MTAMPTHVSLFTAVLAAAACSSAAASCPPHCRTLDHAGPGGLLRLLECVGCTPPSTSSPSLYTVLSHPTDVEPSLWTTATATTAAAAAAAGGGALPAPPPRCAEKRCCKAWCTWIPPATQVGLEYPPVLHNVPFSTQLAYG